jgi:polysaccharide pyruvyl transferase WcaK-like protein
MIYHVFANRSNIGDWLSAKGIQKLLAPAPVKECLCDEPYIPETIEILSQASEQDLIIIGGGGLLMDYFEPFWEAFRPIAQRVPFCIWGIGYCDLKREHSHPPGKLMEDIINQSKLCIVRDELSRTYLPDCELPAPVPCPSINVISCSLPQEKDLLHVNNYSTAGADVYEHMVAVSKAYADAKGIIYRETNNRVEKDRVAEMQRLLDVYAKSEIVVSSALHGCIIAVAMGRKVIAISGDRKIEAFMEAVGLGDWVLDIEEMDLFEERLEQIPQQQHPIDKLDAIKRANELVAEQIKSLPQYATLVSTMATQR